MELLEIFSPILTVLGLVISTIYSSKALKASRNDSELNMFNTMSERYNKIIESLMAEQKFQVSDPKLLGETKFKIYAIFEIFSVVHATKPYQTEIGRSFWCHWERRIEFLATKPAVRAAWNKHRKNQDQLYSKEFIIFMNQKLGSEKEITQIAA